MKDRLLTFLKTSGAGKQRHELHGLPHARLAQVMQDSLGKSLWIGFAAAIVLSAAPACAQSMNSPETLVVDANAPSHPFPHFWEKVFGSGRAILSLRESYRQDLRDVKQITDFEYVRFHAIFHDEVGVYSEDEAGRPIYNFSYVDQIYDGLLANGLKPFVELSFMPDQLAARKVLHSFWYKPDISPPKDWDKWDELIAAFAAHLIDRYGIDEVASWYFEVWNEPNLDFWAGEPKQETYWQLYDHTVEALKKVNTRLRVGGPATAQAAWVSAFIRHCADNKIPVDFVSTHVYANDRAQDVFGTDEKIPRDKMVCRAVRKVHNEIKTSLMPDLALIWSEYNASYRNEPEVTDSAYMGPWLADTIRQCDGLVEMMSYWTFSDVFEEQGVVKSPFYGGYGLIAANGIPKPAYRAIELLHKLGEERIALDSDNMLVTRRSDGVLVAALWNYGAPGQTGTPKRVTIYFKNTHAQRALIWRLDADHADAQSEYKKMGDPPYPTQQQIKRLQAASELKAPEKAQLKDKDLVLSLPSPGLVLIEIK
jgi:xylan 1,4-beta-xylosidase